MALRRVAAGAAVLVIGLIVAGCAGTGGTSGSDDARSEGSTRGPVGDGSTQPASTSVPDDGPVGQLSGQYGVRYCEVLTVVVGESATTAEVWGSQGLNDCPQAAFEALDPAAVVADMEVSLAIPNGPRYWVLDDIVANEIAGSGEVRAFGDLPLRSVATVELGPGLPDRADYDEVSVARDTEFSFDAGREIYELTAPDGSVYVMQSYSVEVDRLLTLDDLADIGDRLHLPAGWTFSVRTLAEPLVVTDIDGVATVVQDDLNNSYQLRTRG